MFDVGFWELAIIGVVGLIVLGPERLPRAARTVALWMKKAKRIVAEMKSEIEREIDMEDMKKVVDEDTVNSLQEFKKEVNDSVDKVKESINIDKDDLAVKMDDPAGFDSLNSTKQSMQASQSGQSKAHNDK